jgi:hypothetical protein
MKHFPWAWKRSDLVAVRPVAIDIDHTPRRQWLRIGTRVDVRIRGAYGGAACVISGHHREGEELQGERLPVDDGPLILDYSGTCGYGSTFEYRG